MKTIVGAFLLFLSAQALAQLTPAQQVAVHQAKTMADSLGLSAPQMDSLYARNMWMANQKKAARQQHMGSMEDTRVAMQKVENMRDSLYRAILPADKYQAYLQKKISLLKP